MRDIINVDDVQVGDVVVNADTEEPLALVIKVETVYYDEIPADEPEITVDGEHRRITLFDETVFTLSVDDQVMVDRY